MNKEILKRLQDYDPYLNLRYSSHKKCLVLERKAPFGGLYLSPGVISDPDEKISVLKGYRLITTIPVAQDTLKIPSLSSKYTFIHYHNGLDNIFWDWLYTGDIYRTGASKFADNIVRARLDDEYKRQLDFKDYCYYKARERQRYQNTVRTVPENKPLSAPPGGMSIN